MKDQWTGRLSEYLDGELGAGERAALEAHLDTCASCRTTLGELRRVVARAQALDDQPPARDLWPAIARRIGAGGAGGGAVVDLAARRERRRFSFTVPQLAAAGIALVLVSSGVVWSVLARREHTPAPTPVAIRAGDPTTVREARWPAATAGTYDAAVAELEATLARHRAALDTATVRVLEKNLQIIDRAIAQARAALAADPGSAYLNHHLARTMRHKVDLLRQANALVAQRT
jgi:anti-sigma factor RsiW